MNGKRIGNDRVTSERAAFYYDFAVFPVAHASILIISISAYADG